MDFRDYDRTSDVFSEKYIGKRARLLATEDDPEQEGTTGRFVGAEGGLDFVMDQPLPAWCFQWEDARTGRLYFDGHPPNGDDALFEVVNEDFPIHSGQPVKSRKM